MQPNIFGNLSFLLLFDFKMDTIFNLKNTLLIFNPCILIPVSTQVSYQQVPCYVFPLMGNVTRVLFYTKVQKFKVMVAIPTTSQPLSSYEFFLLLIPSLNFCALKYIKAICLPSYCCGICLQFMLQGSLWDCDRAEHTELLHFFFFWQ